jgi:hypothetical protein
MTHHHPLADLFPMMADDDLADLAADIRDHGQLHPILVDEEDRIVDGRNRARACEIAGVEPRTEVFTGDIAALVVSANLARRNLKKGQQAMALAMIYPETRRGRGAQDGARKGAETSSFSYRRLQQARTVLSHSRALAEDVIADRVSLDVALNQVQAEQRASETATEKRARLGAIAPDLADLVDDERLGLDEALAAADERKRQADAMETNKRETFYRLAEGAFHGTTAFANEGFTQGFVERLADPEFARMLLLRVRPQGGRLADIVAGAEVFIEILKRVTKTEAT